MMDKICKMFHDVLAGYAAEGEFKTPAEVKTAKAAISGILKIKTLEAMEHYTEDNQSFKHSMNKHHDIRAKLENMMQEADGDAKEILREMLAKM